jgi:hypothetical protein
MLHAQNVNSVKKGEYFSHKNDILRIDDITRIQRRSPDEVPNRRITLASVNIINGTHYTKYLRECENITMMDITEVKDIVKTEIVKTDILDQIKEIGLIGIIVDCLI